MSSDIPSKRKKSKSTAQAADATPVAPTEPVPAALKQKKRKRAREEDSAPADAAQDTVAPPPKGATEEKKKKKRKVQVVTEVADEVENSLGKPEDSEGKKQKKKAKSRKGEAEEAQPVNEAAEPTEAQVKSNTEAHASSSKESKKRKKNPAAPAEDTQPSQTETLLDSTVASGTTDHTDGAPKKKKEKWSAERKAAAKKERDAKLVEDHAENTTAVAVASVEPTPSAAEGKKKRRKSAIDTTENSPAVNASVDATTSNIPAEVPVSSNHSPALPSKKSKKRAKDASVNAPPPKLPSPPPVPVQDESDDGEADSDAAVSPENDENSIKGDEAGEDADEAESGAEDYHLQGFSSDEDSSDDDLGAEEWSGIADGTLPIVARDDATVKQKLEKAKRKPVSDRGVVYLGRIPHGFYENEMRAYFSQFGDITRLRLSRSKKTGRSKHYGFIEFESSAVAEIVAETMDNYLLVGHILRCKVIPKEEVHPSLWIGANRKWRQVPHDRIARVNHNKPRTEDAQRVAEERLLKRQQAKKRKLLEAGIDYNFDAVAYKKPKAVTSQA